MLVIVFPNVKITQQKKLYRSKMLAILKYLTQICRGNLYIRAIVMQKSEIRVRWRFVIGERRREKNAMHLNENGARIR